MFVQNLDWNAEAARIIAILMPSRIPRVISHLGGSAIIGPAHHSALLELPALAAATGETIRGRAEVGDTVCYLTTDAPEGAEFYLSGMGGAAANN